MKPLTPPILPRGRSDEQVIAHNLGCLVERLDRGLHLLAVMAGMEPCANHITDDERRAADEGIPF